MTNGLMGFSSLTWSHTASHNCFKAKPCPTTWESRKGSSLLHVPGAKACGPASSPAHAAWQVNSLRVLSSVSAELFSMSQ